MVVLKIKLDGVLCFAPLHLAVRESMAGFVIQTTRIMEFEDGLWIGNHLKAQNGLQRAPIIPEAV